VDGECQPDEPEVEFAAPAPQGAVSRPTIDALPTRGFVYGVTRYADVILERSFPLRLADLCAALAAFDAHLDELRAGGGSRTPFVTRFDESLERRGWGKRRIEIAKTIDGQLVSQVRGHEIDMFASGSDRAAYPGVAVEMEWNNKDPFFDRDLLNFMALHREGVVAVGVVVTRGPTLQRMVKPLFVADGSAKYGESTTHWNKLVPRVDLGGGGECPLLLIGIEPESIRDFDRAAAAYRQIVEIEKQTEAWRGRYASHRDAVEARRTGIAAVRATLE
jgi:hypothetical protein